MIYKLNGIGKHRVNWQIKELPNFVWSGIALFAIFFLLAKSNIEEKAFQVFMYLWSFLIFFATSIFIPVNLKRKIKKVILSIEFLDNKIKIETQKGIFLLKNIAIQRELGRFTGFGKNHTNGYILKNKNEKMEYWLIETFFNEFEEIESELKNYHFKSE